MNIVYEKPTISKSTSSGPLAIANKGFPYNDIADSRRFEELLYSIYKTKIENNSFGQFDDISLMTGIRDQGRDCVLIRNGKQHGLIQCKKYDHKAGYNADETIAFCQKLDSGEIEVSEENIMKFLRPLENHPTVVKYR